MYQHLFICLLFLSSGCSLFAQQHCALKISQPSCERLTNPIGIDHLTPRFSWHLSSNCSNQTQKAYHILVASSAQKLQQNEGDIWDSQQVKSAKNLNILFKGTPLKTAQTYYWKVRTWNATDIASPWSTSQYWTMGLINTTANKADWIGLDLPIDSASKEQKEAAHYVYTTFETPKSKTLEKAIAFVSGVGLFDLYINGNLISNHRLNPSNTNYFKRALYVGFDVTTALAKGKNALGIVLGNGKHSLQRGNVRKYGLPKAWCQVHLQYSDGSSEIIKSDQKWKHSIKGPIRFNNEFDGEHYDASMEIANWATPQMDVSDWNPVAVLDAYQPILSPQLMPPVRVVKILNAKAIYPTKEGSFIFDFGQNVTGWGKLVLKGKKGTKISLRFAELVDSIGQLDTASIRGAKAKDVFILKGNGVEIFEPRFTYHGFRYVEVTGLQQTPDSSILKACVAHNDLNTVGSFVSSNPLLNQIYSNARWSVRGNYQHVPVDCPQRDERYGWLGDRAATAFGELYLYDIHHFYNKWMQDIADEQLASGALPNLAPAHWEVYRDNVTWPATYVQLVGLLYRYYDDSLVVDQHYNKMQKWMRYIATNYSFEHIIYSDQYGDWLVPPEKVTQDANEDARIKSSADILATATYLLAVKDMYTFASLLQKKEEALFYKNSLDTLKEVLYNRLMDKSQHSYGNHSPTELLLLLANNELSSANRALLLSNLRGMLQGQFNGKMAFGLVGMRWPMQVLSESGAVDFAYQLATSKTYPSWGYMVDQGATTMWEVWTGKAKKSHNHVMLIGDLLQWFYAYLGGIQQAKDGNAFNKLTLIPYLPTGLDSVAVTFLSPRGKIVSQWKKSACKFNWTVEIPVGTSAELYLPYDKPASLKKNNRFVRLDTLSQQKVYAVFELGSGVHTFECALAKKGKIKTYSTPPEISLQDSIIAQKKDTQYLVELSPLNPRSKIYYTLDGSDPTTKSTRYKKPFELTDYAQIKAISKEKGKAVSYVKNSFVDLYQPSINGWNYSYYEARLQQLPNFDTLTAVDSGKVAIIRLKHLKKRRHFWAFKFEAYIEIPTDGVYTFYLASDDGAQVLINNKSVVMNDGIHYRTQRKGSIELTKGRHPIRMEHFNWWSYNGLELLVSGPNVPRQRVPISWLYYKK